MSVTDNALEGVRVLDFTQAVYGALATQLLGDAGADVIKVEPLWGDFGRLSREAHGGDSTMWLGVNRSKRSLTIDLTREDGKATIREMVPSCDIVIHNFRPSTATKLGIDFESIRQLNDRIVHISLLAWGPTGPMSRWGGGDMWAQAFGGVVATQGTEGGTPYLSGIAFVDHGGAALAAFTVLAALRRRDNSGEAQEVTSSLLDTVLFMQAGQVGDYLIEDMNIVRAGRGWRENFPYGAYTASDGDVVTIHGADDTTWKTLVTMLGIEELLEDPRYATAEDRQRLRAELYPKLDAGFATKTRAEWQTIFHANHMRCDPCLTYSELFNHPQTIENDIVLEWERGSEPARRTIGVPYAIGGERPKPERPPPARGQHSREVLEDFGLDAAAIDALVGGGTVIEGEVP